VTAEQPWGKLFNAYLLFNLLSQKAKFFSASGIFFPQAEFFSAKFFNLMLFFISQ